MVAMNAETYARDVREVEAGGYLLYDSTWPRSALLQRADVTVLGVPLRAAVQRELRRGAQAHPDEEHRLRRRRSPRCSTSTSRSSTGCSRRSTASKPKLLESNSKALRLGYDYARKHLACPLPLRLEHMDRTRGHILIDGNTAAGLGCVYAGATVGAWYPITPSTSLMDAFKGFCEQLPRATRQTGEHRYAIIQAEDELAAIGMVHRRVWNGARAFTSTAGPGISLMNEFIGLAYYAEIPCVIFDVQRVGPSTGMPTRTQQGDILLCAYASHGDTQAHPALPRQPGGVLRLRGAGLRPRRAVPDAGVHALRPRHRHERLGVPRPRVGRRATGPTAARCSRPRSSRSLDKFYRYSTATTTASPPARCPGVEPKGAYFTRGSGHNKFGGYTEDPGRVPGGDGPAAAQAQTAADATCRAP